MSIPKSRFSHAMKTDKASVHVDSTGRKMVRLTSTILAYKTRPLSVPVATVNLQTRSNNTSATPITAKGISKARWLLVHFLH